MESTRDWNVGGSECRAVNNEQEAVTSVPVRRNDDGRKK